MRNRLLVAGLAVVIASICTVTMAAPPLPAQGTGAEPVASEPPVIGVDALMKAPEKYPGKIRVQGVVRKVFVKERRLGLLDARYMNCCSTPCETEKLLPVTWAGDMPRLRALVLVTGEARKAGGTFEFVAASIATVAPSASTNK